MTPGARSAARTTALAAAVVLLGVLWLLATAPRAFVVLSWSDEIVYAVMGRNIADGRGIVSNFYDWRALLQDGYPQGDVHMPGHALFMSVFFRLLGSADAVAFVPSRVALLAAGVVVLLVARRLFGSTAGVVAAALLFVMPGAAGFAHSAMPESTVLLASSLFLACWCAPVTPPRAFGLAVALAAAVLCRETMLVFLWPAAVALSRAPRDVRSRAMAAFVLGLAATLPGVALLYLRRARFPHFLSDLPPLGTAAWARVVGKRIGDNLALPLPGSAVDEQLFVTLLVLGIVLPLAVLRRASVEGRPLAAALLALTAANFAGLVAFYPLKSWAAVRAFMFLIPWAAVLLAGVVMRVRATGARVAVALAVALLAVQSLATVSALAADRRAEQTGNAEVAAVFERLTEGVPIETVLGYESPWEIGWRRFPIVVVWNAPAGLDPIRRLTAVRRIDAVIGRSPHVVPIAEASARGELPVAYDLVRRRRESQRQVVIRRGLTEVGSFR